MWQPITNIPVANGTVRSTRDYFESLAAQLSKKASPPPKRRVPFTVCNQANPLESKRNSEDLNLANIDDNQNSSKENLDATYDSVASHELPSVEVKVEKKTEQHAIIVNAAESMTQLPPVQMHSHDEPLPSVPCAVYEDSSATSGSDTSSDYQDVHSNEDDAEVVTKKRSLVRRESMMVVDSASQFRLRRKFFKRIYVVSLVDASEATVTERIATKLSDEELKKRRIPHVEYQYPVSGNPHQDAMIAMLCMPDFVQNASSTHIDTMQRSVEVCNTVTPFPLVLSDEHAERTFGYCARIEKQHNSRVVCLLSALHSAAKLYAPVVQQMAELLTRDNEPVMTGSELDSMSRDLYDTPAPERPLSLPSASGLLDMMKTPQQLDALTMAIDCLLAEYRVVVSGGSVASVSNLVLLLDALIHPFTWPHTLVPIVPDTYTELINIPTPSLLGVLRSNLRHVPHLLKPSTDGVDSHVLIIDTDIGTLRMPAKHRPTGTILVLRKVRTALSRIANKAKNAANNNERQALEDSAARVFRMSIVAMIANHHEYCTVAGQLDEAAFVESANHPNRLQRLIDTTLFQLWHNTIASSDGDVFRRQMKQYRQELDNSRTSIVKKVKKAVSKK